MVMSYIYGKTWLQAQWDEFVACITKDAERFNQDFLTASLRLNNVHLLEQLIALSSQKLIVEAVNMKGAVSTFFATFLKAIEIEQGTLKQQLELVDLAGNVQKEAHQYKLKRRT